MTVLFVSHDMAAITRLCDRVLWLSAGEVVKIGDPEEVVAEYQNSARSFTARRLKGRGTHKNEHGELVSVSLLSPHGHEVGALRREDEVLVQVGIRMDRADVAVRFVVHVSKGATLAFRVASEGFPIERPGVYFAVVRIPPNILAETMYSLNVEAVIMRPDSKSSLTAYNALTFRVFDPSNERRDQLGGVVAPAVAWDFRLEESAASALLTKE
jgi:lipopolysaccharide transport system ATP-binding protein